MLENQTTKEKWQNRNEMILQSVAEGICVVNQDNRISFVNPSALKMLGWEFSEIVGQRYEIIFGKEPDDSDATLFPIQFALTEGETTHVRNETFYHRDGSNFLVEYFCVPIKLGHEIAEAVITFQDVSERRDLENAVDLARQNALEGAQEKANFLANMSHEIRTPLNGIIGIAELLAATSLSFEQTKYLETLQTSANLLLDIVNDILDFSKIEANKVELEIIDFDLHQVIAETIQLFVPEAVKKRLQLKFEVEKDLYHCLSGDAGRLRQILNNLVSNAIKFTHTGEVFLKVKQQGEFLLFEVSDTGIGIEKDHQAKIFEPFMQADISTTRHFGGTGLGLAISKQLAQMMGGEIGVKSESESGSTFWFTAKFAKQEKLEGSLRVDFQSLKQVFSNPDSPQILVVEDNQINQEVALGRLRQLGIMADIANNGLEAVKAVKEKKYDLILMDCRMPEMDGFEATEQIRKLNGSSKNIKIIAMTASVTVGEREYCLAAGMDDYLAKPMTLETLADTLNRHLKCQIVPNQPDSEANMGKHPLAEILDEQTLKNFLDIESRGEKNFAKEMLIVYLKHTETQLAQVENAFLTRSGEIIKNKAHSLRGSSGNIGITSLFQAFGQLEKEVEKENWITTGKIIDKVLQELANINEKVSKLN